MWYVAYETYKCEHISGLQNQQFILVTGLLDLLFQAKLAKLDPYPPTVWFPIFGIEGQSIKLWKPAPVQKFISIVIQSRRWAGVCAAVHLTANFENQFEATFICLWV